MISDGVPDGALISSFLSLEGLLPELLPELPDELLADEPELLVGEPELPAEDPELPFPDVPEDGLLSV